MSSSPESATMNPDLFIYKNPTVNPDLEGGSICDPSKPLNTGDTFGRSHLGGDDVGGISSFGGFLRSEAMDISDNHSSGSDLPSSLEDSESGDRREVAGEKRSLVENTKSKLAILAMSAVGFGLGGNAVASADNTERAAGPSAGAEVSKQGKITPFQIRTLTVRALLRERGPTPEFRISSAKNHLESMNLIGTTIGRRGNILKLDGKGPNNNNGGNLDFVDYPRIPKIASQYYAGPGDKPVWLYGTGPAEGVEKGVTYKPILDSVEDRVIEASGKPAGNFGPSLKTQTVKTRNGWSKAVTVFGRAKNRARSIRAVVQNKAGNVTKIARYK